MRIFLIYSIIIIISAGLQSCKENITEKKEVAPTLETKTITITETWDKTDCNTDKLDTLLESRIDSVYYNLIAELKSCPDTARTIELIKALQNDKSTYLNTIENEAEMVYGSYGAASYNGERPVARDCYYYNKLNEKYLFLVAIYKKTKGNLLDLPKNN